MEKNRIPVSLGLGGGIDSEGGVELVIAVGHSRAVIAARQCQPAIGTARGGHAPSSPPGDWWAAGRREQRRAAIGGTDVPPPAEAGSGAEPRDPVSVGAALWGARRCIPSSRRGLSLSSLPFSPLPPPSLPPSPFPLPSWWRGGGVSRPRWRRRSVMGMAGLFSFLRPALLCFAGPTAFPSC